MPSGTMERIAEVLYEFQLENPIMYMHTEDAQYKEKIVLTKYFFVNINLKHTTIHWANKTANQTKLILYCIL